MNTSEEKEKSKDDFSRGIAYFWRSTNLEPRIRSVALCDGISKIALGNHHTLLLTFNSQLLSVGDNSFGQLGLGDFKPRREPTVVDYFRDKRVLEISCGGHHSGVICANNEVFFWGDSSSGQCGVGEIKLVNQPCQVQFEHSNTPCSKEESVDLQQDKATKKKPVIKQIACGDSHSLALSATGDVWSWGTGCQLGHGVETEQVNAPKKIDFLTGRNVTSVVCGAYHSLAIVQGNKPGPAFVLSKSENVTTKTAQKPKHEKVKKKQRRGSKELPKKSQTVKHHEGSTSPQKAKVDKHDMTCQSNTKNSSVTRTYLSYEPVLRSENDGSSSGAMEADKQPTPKHGENGAKGLTKQLQNSDSLDYVDVSTAEATQLAPDESVSKNDSSLTICDSHFADPEQTILDKYFHISSDQVKSSQEAHSAGSTESNEIILYSSASPLFPSSPSSTGSLTYFTSTDSDSEDSLTKGCRERKGEETGFIGKNSSGFYSSFGSRLIRSDVNLSKLTSAVVGSVAGMFIASVPGQLSLRDPPGAVTAKMPCKHCGLIGLCLCDAGCGKFNLAGSDTQVWSWGRGGCGQLGLGDTDDR